MDIHRKYIIKLIREKIESERLNDNFWKWFGNSKIVAGGKPMVVYHGSPNNHIESFDFKMIGSSSGNEGHYGYGIYFSDSITEVKTYGNTIYECYLKIENPFTGTEKQIMELKESGLFSIDDLVPKMIDYEDLRKKMRGNRQATLFMEVYGKYGLSNAWKAVINRFGNNIDGDFLNDLGEILNYTEISKDDFSSVPGHILKLLEEIGISPKMKFGFEYEQSLHWITDLGRNSKYFTDFIKKKGYDGVWYVSEIVAFEPSQIKSVGNDGSWSTSDDNIYP